MDSSQFAREICDWISKQSEYTNVHIDEDGDVVFKEGSRSFYVDIPKEDPSLFRVVFPNFFKISKVENRIQALEACGDVALQQKNIYCYILRSGDICAASEVFLTEYDGYQSILGRQCRALVAAAQNFATHYKSRCEKS